MEYGYVVFIIGFDPATETLDWRPAGSALPSHSRPVFVADGNGNTTTLHGYPDGYLIGGKTIDGVAAEAEAARKIWA